MSDSIKAIPFFLLLFCASSIQAQSGARSLPLTTTATLPHDSRAFTQGLFYEDGYLYESTGGYGKSTLRQVEPATGKVVRRISVPRQYFAEGLERVGDRLFLLTWREGYCLVFDKNTFELKENFRYSGEGWGLTFDGKHLIMSDGSSFLRFLDPKDFEQKRRIQVTNKDARSKKSAPVEKLNELEFIRGEIWANVWQTNNIVRIDPKSGDVIGWIDCSVFVPERYKAELTTGPTRMRDNVLNGIAFDPATGKVYLTGKNWPVLYEVQIGETE